jgi:ABC-2 type transport system ATP-binding protein
MDMPEQSETCNPILSARNLIKSYGALVAVQNVSFDIGPGQVLGVLGPNGSGKSTIVKMVTGLLDPTQGNVFFRGRNIRDELLDYRQSLAYVPEQSDLYGFLTGWEYVEMVAALRGLNRQLARDRATTLFEAFGLSDARGQFISSFSKGMRQRIVLICALIHNPQFLVLDEPFSGLDVTSGLILRRLIQLLALSGKGILFSSPVLEQMDRVCTDLLLLRSGQVVAAGSMEEMRTRFAGLNLEAGFWQLADPANTGTIANTILEAMGARMA